MSETSRIKNFFRFFISKIFIKNILIIILLLFVLIGGTFLWLKIYTNHNQEIKVPDLRGLTLNEAKEKITKHKLRYKIIDSVYNPRGKKGSVIDQNPKSGFIVKKNRTIFFIINAYMQEEVSMPDVLGISITQAKTDIESAGLSMGKFIFVPSDYKKLVLEQQLDGRDIKPGKKVQKNTPIDLVVGMGLEKEDAQTHIPDLMGLTIDQAKSKLNRALLNVGTVIYDKSVTTYKDSVSAKVWEQSPLYTLIYTLTYGESIDLKLTTNENKLKFSILALENSTETADTSETAEVSETTTP